MEPPPAACAATPRAAALQEAGGPCYSLGTSATRKVAATENGTTIRFFRGDGSRSSIITVECADLPSPEVVHWSHGATPGVYNALVRARAGCALECGRSATGAICGGATHGSCIADSADYSPAYCKCAGGHHGRACTRVLQAPTDKNEDSWVFRLTHSGSFVLCAAFLFAAVIARVFATELLFVAWGSVSKLLLCKTVQNNADKHSSPFFLVGKLPIMLGFMLFVGFVFSVHPGRIDFGAPSSAVTCAGQTFTSHLQVLPAADAPRPLLVVYGDIEMYW